MAKSWPIKDGADCRYVRPTVADPGESDDANRRCANEGAASARSWRGHRGKTPLHDDARCGKAELGHENVLLARCFQRRRANAFRIPLASERLIWSAAICRRF